MGKQSFLIVGVALLAAGIPSFALAEPQVPPARAEVGYAQGALGVSALLDGDYAAAASRLAKMEGTTAGDPARLINLGNAYAGMGRSQDAMLAYRAAIKAMPVDLMLADGTVASSRIIAKQALKRLMVAYASR